MAWDWVNRSGPTLWRVLLHFSPGFKLTHRKDPWSRQSQRLGVAFVLGFFLPQGTFRQFLELRGTFKQFPEAAENGFGADGIH